MKEGGKGEEETGNGGMGTRRERRKREKSGKREFV